MATTFIPTITGKIVEITEGIAFATDWTIEEAVDRASRLAVEADEYATEAMLVHQRGDADPAVFLAGARQRLAMAEALNAALRSFA